MNQTEYKIHPFADIYPMLDSAELQELAEDIKANGLINPIIVMGDVLIDGRNRLAACKLAGVEPKFQESDGALDDDQIKSLILSLNNARRHLCKGQKAMAVALAYPDNFTGNRFSRSLIIKDLEISSGPLAQARKILRFTPLQAADVMKGKLPLSKAYEIAQKVEDDQKMAQMAVVKRTRDEKEAERIRDAAAGDEEKRLQLMREATAAADANYVKNKIAALAIADPELADAVRTGAITLENADALLAARQEETKSLEITARLELKDFVEFFRRYRKPSFRDQIGKAVTCQLNDDHREAACFLVDFINEFIPTGV